jgi:antibiotic biosynthesis monooxygenase (ABM) superfamily enzyme
MSQTQNLPNDPSVTVVISRRVKPECKAEFELFLLGITTACEKFHGYLGSNIFPPVSSEDPEYRIIFKFDRLSNLRNWETSSERKYWFDIAEPLTVSPPQIQVLTGLESWFILSGRNSITPPPRYKMTVVTWLAVFPLITFISLILKQQLLILPLVFRVAIVTAIAVPTMTYLLMPQMTKLFAGWLYPSLGTASPVTDIPAQITEGSQLPQPLAKLDSVENNLELVASQIL